MNTAWSVLYPHHRTPWAGVAADGRTPLTYEPETGEVVHVDPRADAKLPGLRQAMARSELISYRPGRRATLRRRRSDRSEHLKVLRPGRTEATVQRHEAFATIARQAGFAAPHVVDVDARSGVVVFETLPGETIDRTARSIPAERWEHLGIHLGLLAGQPAPTELTTADDDAPFWLGAVAAWDPCHEPEFHERAMPLLAHRPDSGSNGPVHGDLHAKNVMAGGVGFGLIDLDSAHVGDSRADIAGLIAQLELQAIATPGAAADLHLAIERTSRGYTWITGERESVITAMAGRELARLACVHRFRRPGMEYGMRLIERAEQLTEHRR